MSCIGASALVVASRSVRLSSHMFQTFSMQILNGNIQRNFLTRHFVSYTVYIKVICMHSEIKATSLQITLLFQSQYLYTQFE